MNDTDTTKLTIKNVFWIIISCIIIFGIGFEFGFLSHPLVQTTINMNAGNYTFDIGNNTKSVFDKNIASNPRIFNFSCSTMWYDFGLKCDGQKFVNETGMYCNKTLVCQNG